MSVCKLFSVLQKVTELEKLPCEPKAIHERALNCLALANLCVCVCVCACHFRVQMHIMGALDSSVTDCDVNGHARSLLDVWNWISQTTEISSVLHIRCYSYYVNPCKSFCSTKMYGVGALMGFGIKVGRQRDEFLRWRPSVNTQDFKLLGGSISATVFGDRMVLLREALRHFVSLLHSDNSFIARLYHIRCMGTLPNCYEALITWVL